MLSRHLCLAALVSLAFAAPSGARDRAYDHAGVMPDKIGAGYQTDCRRAAEARATSRGAVHACNAALHRMRLSRNDRAATFANRGVLFSARGELERARADYERALEIKPDLAEAHLNLGTLEHRQGRVEAAISRYEQALATGLRRPAIGHYNLGVALRQAGRPERAEAAFRAALRARPGWDRAQDELRKLTTRGRRA